MDLRVWSTISGIAVAVVVVGAISYYWSKERSKESGGSKESAGSGESKTK